MSPGPMCSSVPSGVTATNEPAAGSTELTTARCEVTQAPSRSRDKRDHPVPGPVAPPSFGFQLRSGKMAQFLPHQAGGRVEPLHGVTVVGHQEGVFAFGDVVGPGPDHVQQGLAPGGSRVDPAVQYVPGRRHGHLPGPQLVEGVALGRVTLADVLGEGKDVTGVTAGQALRGHRRGRRRRAGGSRPPRWPVPRQPLRHRAAWPFRHRGSCRSRPRRARGEG